MTTLYHGSSVSVPMPLTGVSRQAIVDNCLRFIGAEPVTEKGGQR